MKQAKYPDLARVAPDGRWCNHEPAELVQHIAGLIEFYEHDLSPREQWSSDVEALGRLNLARARQILNAMNRRGVNALDCQPGVG